MTRVLLICVTCLLLTPLTAQRARIAGLGGGEYVFEHGECLPEGRRAAIQAELNEQIALLRSSGKLPAMRSADEPRFIWPLKQNARLDYFHAQAISGFVDHDESFPFGWRDYNCGDRTYDLSTGYNHKGTDIYLWPFPWQMVDNDLVEVVAAAPGVIIAKHDGFPDRNCDFSNPNWNAVYIRHEDGSVAWYGHMKRNSLTTKITGDRVDEGEFLGIVGSSGSSTGPHLHFEVYDAAGSLIDPFEGDCNTLTDHSWWVDQRPYYDSRLNALLTHGAVPYFAPCPEPDSIHLQTSFPAGQQAIFAAYYSDQLAGQVTQYRIVQPDGAVFAAWSHSSPAPHYPSSYWFWTYVLPADALCGIWKFEASYQGREHSREFHVAGTAGGPQPQISGDTILCNANPADVVQLDAGPGYVSYLWSTGATGVQLLPANSPGVYCITVTDGGGCTGSDCITVSGIEPPLLQDILGNQEPAAGDTILYYLLSPAAGSEIAWDVDGGELLSADGPLATVLWSSGSLSGRVCYVETLEGNCATGGCLDVNIRTTSIGAGQEVGIQLRIRPNPASDQLFVSGLAGDGYTEYDILDIYGRVVMRGRLENDLPVIDVRGVSPGMAVLRILRKGGVAPVSLLFVKS